MSGAYRVPNKHPDERADGPFRIVLYPEKHRDIRQKAVMHLTPWQRSEIRAKLRVAIDETRQYRATNDLAVDRSFTLKVYALADHYGVSVPVILRVWRGRGRTTRP